jgi:enoyl-CoA hydratase/carnithine racemase
MDKIIIEQSGPVKTIWMNRPEKRNALDSEMLQEMTAVLRAPLAAGDRVLVIRGKGPSFCSDLNMARRRESMGSGQASGIEEMLRAIEVCPLPVVAVVQGDAIAGGNELALHCDLVLASENSRFGMSLAQVGIAPNWFLAKKLMEVLGPVTTREMLLLGDPLPATRLHALGLIPRCVPEDALEAEADKVIARLAARRMSIAHVIGTLNSFDLRGAPGSRTVASPDRSPRRTNTPRRPRSRAHFMTRRFCFRCQCARLKSRYHITQTGARVPPGLQVTTPSWVEP